MPAWLLFRRRTVLYSHPWVRVSGQTKGVGIPNLNFPVCHRVPFPAN